VFKGKLIVSCSFAVGKRPDRRPNLQSRTTRKSASGGARNLGPALASRSTRGGGNAVGPMNISRHRSEDMSPAAEKSRPNDLNHSSIISESYSIAADLANIASTEQYLSCDSSIVFLIASVDSPRPVTL
jgi:hypothetical protein